MTKKSKILPKKVENFVKKSKFQSKNVENFVQKIEPGIDLEANYSSIRNSAFVLRGMSQILLVKDKIPASVESGMRFRRFWRFAPDFLETPSDLPILGPLKRGFRSGKRVENLHLRSSEEGAARIPLKKIVENFIFFV